MATLGLAACAEPPSQEVSANKQAVQSAQQPAAAPYSPEYDPRAYVSTADLDTTVAIRLDALEVIDRYNTVLVTLAEGKPDREVQSAVGAFSHSLSALLTAAGPAIPALNAIVGDARTIAALAESARQRAQFERIADVGAPVVGRIIDEVFLQDKEDLTEIRTASADRQSRLLRRSAGETARTASLIGAQHRNPPADSALASSRATAQQRLHEVMAQVGSQAKTYSVAGQTDRRLFDLSGLETSGQDYTDVVQVRIDRLVAAAEHLATKYRMVVDETAQTHARLGTAMQAVNQGTFPNAR
jgi:hypothetical protein